MARGIFIRRGLIRLMVLLCSAHCGDCWLQDWDTDDITQLLISTADVIDVVRPLGSDGGRVLLLLNSALVCWVELDCEFGRLTVQHCLVVETSVKPYQDETLPRRVGEVVSHAFRSPLLFVLCEDGHVCILVPSWLCAN